MGIVVVFEMDLNCKLMLLQLGRTEKWYCSKLEMLLSMFKGQMQGTETGND